MESVYGLYRLAANAGECETWMDRFMQLEPEGGFRAIVQQAWSGNAPAPRRIGSLVSMNGRVAMKPVYGQKFLSADAGLRESWMDRFMKLEPEGGFRATVKLTWNGAASASGDGLARLVAFAQAA